MNWEGSEIKELRKAEAQLKPGAGISVFLRIQKLALALLKEDQTDDPSDPLYCKQDVTEGIRLLQRLGSYEPRDDKEIVYISKVRVMLGYIYKYGAYDTPKNPKVALGWYLKALELVRLLPHGYIYNPISGPVNEYTECSSDINQLPSDLDSYKDLRLIIGELLLESNTAIENPEEGLKYLCEYASDKLTDEKEQLEKSKIIADILLKGRKTVIINEADACEWLARAARLGDVDSKLLLKEIIAKPQTRTTQEHSVRTTSTPKNEIKGFFSKLIGWR